MTTDNLRKLLAERTDCMLYYAEPAVSDELRAGWIGGNAPAFFDQPSDLIHESDLTYLFYLTLVHPFKAERMLSIFIPEDYEAYLENNIYPDCAIKVVEHPISTESAKSTYTNTGLNKHYITAGGPSTDEQSMDQPFLIKVGGTPRLIQNEAYYFKKLQEDSLSFLFQVDEDGYPDNLLREDSSYPFGFGALYVFAQIGTTEIQGPVAGFWHYS